MEERVDVTVTVKMSIAVDVYSETQTPVAIHGEGRYARKATLLWNDFCANLRFRLDADERR